MTCSIYPAFASNSICICLSADNNYAPYLGVTIQSIKFNKSDTDKYDVCILDGGISNINKKKILKMVDNYFSIRFININEYMADLDKNIFSTCMHFTIASYFRFFIPKVFSNYGKVIYLDCDLVVNNDIMNLYNVDLEGFAICAAKDIEIYRRTSNLKQYDNEIHNYLSKKLKMKHIETYFQSGVLLLDIGKLKDSNFSDQCLDRLKMIKKPQLVDQDILNSLVDGNYKPLDMKWNVLWQLPYTEKDLDKQLPIDDYNEYLKARENPSIIHYASGIKPWINPDVELADIWWKYARQTPFYEEILYKNYSISKEILVEVLNCHKTKRKYLFYKLLSKITFGRSRQKYKEGRKKLKTKLRQVREFLKGK